MKNARAPSLPKAETHDKDLRSLSGPEGASGAKEAFVTEHPSGPEEALATWKALPGHGRLCMDVGRHPMLVHVVSIQSYCAASRGRDLV
jgi:hypothetical protein